MTKYRKKPVVIEATQWFKNGDHPLDYENKIYDTNLEGTVVRYYRDPYNPGEGECQHCAFVMHYHGWIDTLEGGHIVCPGDWIITGVKGEYYPCKPDVFEMTYEMVEDDLPKDLDEFGFSEEQWRKANPPINERRAKEGLPPYDETIPPPGESP